MTPVNVAIALINFVRHRLRFDTVSFFGRIDVSV